MNISDELVVRTGSSALVLPTLVFALSRGLSPHSIEEAIGQSIDMETSASFVVLRAWHPYDALHNGRILEACADMVNRFLGHHFGPEMRPAEVRFGIERNGSRAAYAEVFGAPVQFGTGEGGVALVFKRSALKAEHRSPSPIAAHLFEGNVAELRPRRRRDQYPVELQRQWRVIAGMLREGRAPTAPDIAKRAGLSLRSAQRLAARYGVTLRELVEEGRIERARVLLIASPTASVDDVAHQLSDADASGVPRAFRRWSGKSIGDLRRRLR